MTPSPFPHLNTARIRAERRASLVRDTREVIAATLIALAITFLIDAAFRTALALPQIVAQAEAQKGMQ